MKKLFQERLTQLTHTHEELIHGKIKSNLWETASSTATNTQYFTAAHAPLFWRYDLNPDTNPYLMERFGINAAFNAGAIKWDGQIPADCQGGRG